jgi:hypothetical protein
MSVDTKKAHDLAEGIYRYTSRNDNAAKMIDDLAYEVERLRKVVEAARVVQHGDCDSGVPYKKLRKAIAMYCEEELA